MRVRRAFALIIAPCAMFAGCGPQDECEEAADKVVSECEFSGYVFDSGIGECKDARQCRAECVNEHSCSELTSPSDDSFANCLADCND